MKVFFVFVFLFSSVHCAYQPPINNRNNNPFTEEDIFSPFQIIKELNNNARCTRALKDVCSTIQNVNKMKCADGTEVKLEQLCDGTPQCDDSSDENNCANTVGEKLKQVMNLSTTMENQEHITCMPRGIIEDQTYIYYYNFLQNTLKQQWDTYQHYLSPDKEVKKKRTSEAGNSLLYMRPQMVSTMLSSVLIGMESFICAPRFELEEDKPTDLNNMFGMSANNNIDPASCICKEQYCESKSCKKQCRIICWQKYILNHWGCETLLGGTAIPLDFICDGKVDCVDANDEKECTDNPIATKNKAKHMFNNVLKILKTESELEDYECLRKDLKQHMAVVHQLLKASTAQTVNVSAVKTLRTKYFNALVDMYEKMRQVMETDRLILSHDFLLTLNEKMVIALKNSHMGNEDVSLSHKCICGNNLCVLRYCTPECSAFCAAKSKLLKFTCGSLELPLHYICNGISECPQREDEVACNKEHCATKHLMQLRRHLENAGTGMVKITVPKIIDNWKSKLILSLKGFEKRNVVQRSLLDNIISTSLEDLVELFSERANETVYKPDGFKPIKDIVDILKNALKSCK